MRSQPISDCGVGVNPVMYSCTCWGCVHLHFTQSQSLPCSRDDDVHKTAVHAAAVTVVCVGFTCSDVSDDGTPDSGGSGGRG